MQLELFDDAAQRRREGLQGPAPLLAQFHPTLPQQPIDLTTLGGAQGEAAASLVGLDVRNLALRHVVLALHARGLSARMMEPNQNQQDTRKAQR